VLIMGKRILLAVFYRLKSHYLIALITLIVTIVSILGTFIVLANINNYIIYETTKEIPIHITLNMRFSGSDRDALIRTIDYMKNFIKELRNQPEINKISMLPIFHLTGYLGVKIYVDNKSNVVGGIMSFSTLYGEAIRFNISEGNIEENKIGIEQGLLESFGLKIGDHIAIEIIDKIRNNTILELRNLEIGYVYTLKEYKGGIGLGGFGVGEPFPTKLPDFIVNESILREIIRKVYSVPYAVSVGENLKMYIDYVLDIVLSEKYLVLYNPDLAYQLIDEFIDNKLSSASENVFGKDIIPEKSSFFFIVSRNFKTTELTLGNSTVDLMSNIDSPIQDTISRLKSTMQFQMTTILVTASLPIFIGSWYLMVVVASIVIYGLRRHLTLLMTRGVPSSSLKKHYMVLLIFIGLIAVIISLPLINLASKLFTTMILGRVFYEPPLTDPFIIVTALVIAVLLTLLVLRRSRKYLDIKAGELSFVTRVFIPAEKTIWKPGTLLTILLIISIIKYAMWLTGFTVADLTRRAIETGNMGLLIALSIYSIIDSLATYIAPFVITYFLVQYITHSGKILNVFSSLITRAVSGSLSDSVKELILRGSSRLYNVSFVIALVFAVSLNYLGMSTSLETWFPDMKEFLINVYGEYSTIQQFSYQGMIYTNKLMVYYGLVLALLSSILMALVLTKDLDKEMVILRARGAGIKDLLRLVYGVLFTVVSISLVIGFVSGIIWLKGGIDGINSGMRVAPIAFNETSNIEIPYVTIVFSIYDLGYVIAIVTLLLLIPLIIIFLRISKPVAEKLRSIG